MNTFVDTPDSQEENIVFDMSGINKKVQKKGKDKFIQIADKKA